MIVSELMHPSDILQNQIEAKRKQMVVNAAECGLSHISTLQLSWELDELLNKYSQLEE